MAGRTKCRFQSAAALMALLLAFAVNVTASATLKSLATGRPLMRRSLGTSEALEECEDELLACSADASCLACVEVFNDKASECGGSDSIVPCDEAQEWACCSLADEAEECYTDTAFTAYMECGISSLNPQCGADAEVDFSDCNGAMGRTTAWGLPSTLISAAVCALLVAAFGGSSVV